MAYSPDSFVADEVPATAKWNKLWSNDASMNDGTGIGDGVLLNRHHAEGVIASEKLNATVAFRAYRSTDQSMTSAVITKVQLDTENYDYGSDFDNATNYRFTAPVDGVYSFKGAARVRAGGSATRTFLNIYKNGSVAGGIQGTDYGASATQAVVAGDLLLTAGDYVELWCYSQAASNPGVQGDSEDTFLCGFLVGEV